MRKQFNVYLSFLCVIALILTFLPVQASASVTKKAYTLSKSAGTYSSKIKVKIKAKKGYRIYYTTGKSYSIKKVIKPGKTKTLTISKTTSLSIFYVKKSVKMTKKKLKKIKLTNAHSATYKYKITTTQSTAIPTPTTSVTATPTVTAAPVVVDDTTDDSYVAPTQAPTDADDNNTEYSTSYNKAILNGSNITVSGSGMTVNGTTLTITAAGTYIISGTLTDGMIEVAAKDTEVHLIFNGVNITNSTGPAMTIKKVSKCVLTLNDGTTNSLTDGSTYSSLDEDGEPDATLYSTKDLTINGTGTLNVAANYANAIKCKDNLRLANCTINVTKAAKNGIIGRDSLYISQCTLNVTSSCDGIKTTNDEDAGMGYLDIDGGDITISCNEDAIQVVYTAIINPTTMKITTTKPSSTTADSFKGIKAGTTIEISSGTFNINSADDSIHSNGSVKISGGSMTLASGDDGIHADTGLIIENGTINVTKSYEGLESADMTIKGGTINLVSSDDGINVNGGKDSSSGSDPFNPQNTGTAKFYMQGGYVRLNAEGDGLDANGSIYMSGGEIYVDGTTSGGNGPIDYDSVFIMSGGTLVAVGSADMAQCPTYSTTGESSTQGCIQRSLSSSSGFGGSSSGWVSAGTKLMLTNSSGTKLVDFTSVKQYNYIVISTPQMTLNSSYTMTVGTTTYDYTLTSLLMTNVTSSGGGGGGTPPGRQ